MNLKDDFCSEIYAKRLKEVGFNQDSVFQWVEVPHKFSIDSNLKKKITETKTQLVFSGKATIEDQINQWAAYTSGQILEILPACIDTKKDEPFNFFWLHIVKRSAPNIRYIVNYFCDTHTLDQLSDPFYATSLIQERIYDEKLADALAKMLIVLLEKGLLVNG